MVKIDKKITPNENPRELKEMLSSLAIDVNRENLKNNKYDIIVGAIAERVSQWKASPQEIAFLNKIYQKNSTEWQELKAELDNLFDSIKLG